MGSMRPYGVGGGHRHTPEMRVFPPPESHREPGPVTGGPQAARAVLLRRSGAGDISRRCGGANKEMQ
ncbi:hypothetical protein ACFYP4_22945 [Streptomyces sp. NPDC005551]|uniref:hypothetical protein n=1 Tax=Streptomyces sp. NPDC005551 TaxID=3364725 RepID=UPI0036AAC3BB